MSPARSTRLRAGGVAEPSRAVAIGGSDRRRLQESRLAALPPAYASSSDEGTPALLRRGELLFELAIRALVKRHSLRESFSHYRQTWRRSESSKFIALEREQNAWGGVFSQHPPNDEDEGEDNEETRKCPRNSRRSRFHRDECVCGHCLQLGRRLLAREREVRV
jgi:hypothetical protein